MALADLIPASKPKARVFDPNTVNVNGVVLQKHGTRKAVIDKFSKVFFEKNIGSEDSPKWERAIQSDPAAKAFIRVYVAMKTLKNLEGNPLILSTKLTASLFEKANLAKLIAGLLGIAPADVQASKVEFSDLVGKEVDVTTKAGRDNIAILQKVEPPKAVIMDDDETPAAPQSVPAAASQAQAQAEANDDEGRHYTDEDFPDQQ